eukprot:scaffold973_cov399-Prasinococcus_capsulatus_cf.AAC.10
MICGLGYGLQQSLSMRRRASRCLYANSSVRVRPCLSRGWAPREILSRACSCACLSSACECTLPLLRQSHSSGPVVVNREVASSS